MNARRSTITAFAVTTTLAVFIGAFTTVATGAPLTLTYDAFVESKTVGSPLVAGNDFLLDGRLRDSTTSAISNRLEFRAGSSAISLSAAWLTNPAENRTVGFNVDLFDASNTVVASDVFLGVNGTLATSQFTVTNLIAGGLYHLQVTGTALQSGRYIIDMAGGATPPPFASLDVVTPAADHALFDTHVGSETFGTTFATGGNLVIDGVLVDDLLSTITNDVLIPVNASTLSAGIEWIVGAQDPQRTTGVNVDLLDAFNNVVASDAFVGIFSEQAFSQLLVTSLLPGNYTLRFTGIAPLGGRYHIHLTTDATPPGFEAINDNPPLGVPEPGSLALLLVALGCLGAGRTIFGKRATRRALR